jgi:tol-pal system protein YbgF
MKTTVILFLSFMLLVSSPVFSVKKDTRLILDQLQKLEDAIKVLDGKITLASQKIKIMEDKVNAITVNQADTGQDKENLMLSLQFIKEEINDLKNRINKINDRLVSLPVTTVSPDTSGTSGETPEDSAIQSPENTYYTAYSDYLKKNYQLAVEGFKQFISLYPQNGLADNALYWIGECYYSQKMYREAVSTFSELIANYADGDKIPDAILKKGYSLIEMGKQSEGIAVLKDLISRFPLSEEASLAQQKIKEVTD